MDNEETGDVLRKEWFRALAEIADVDLQRRKWLDRTNANPHWSFVEFVCSFPDADQLRAAEIKGWLSPAEAAILVQFLQELLAYCPPNNDEYDNEAVLNDPAWRAITASALATLNNLGLARSA